MRWAWLVLSFSHCSYNLWIRLQTAKFISEFVQTNNTSHRSVSEQAGVWVEKYLSVHIIIGVAGLELNAALAGLACMAPLDLQIFSALASRTSPFFWSTSSTSIGMDRQYLQQPKHY